MDDVWNEKFKFSDFGRYQKRRKQFDKKGFVNTYSMKVHEIVGRKGKQFILDNEKAFYEEQLVKANKEENLSELKRKHKQIQKEQRHEKEKKKEITFEDLEKNVVEGKRSRKKKEFKDFVLN